MLDKTSINYDKRNQVSTNGKEDKRKLLQKLIILRISETVHLQTHIY